MHLALKYYDLEPIGNYDWKISQPAMVGFINDIIAPKILTIYSAIPVDKFDVPMGCTIDGFKNTSCSSSIDWHKDVFLNREYDKIYLGVQYFLLKFKRRLCGVAYSHGEIHFRQRIVVLEDPVLHKQRRVGMFGWMEYYDDVKTS